MLEATLIVSGMYTGYQGKMCLQCMQLLSGAVLFIVLLEDGLVAWHKDATALDDTAVFRVQEE